MAALVFVILFAAVVCDDRNLYRTNFGVFLDHEGLISASAATWLHHFEIKLPNINDFEPFSCLNNLDTVKQIESGPCHQYIQGTDHILQENVKKMNLDIAYAMTKLWETAEANLQKLPANRRRKRSAPLSFIGDLSQTLFGTATVESVQRVADSVNSIIKNNRVISQTMARHEKNFASFVSLTNRRFNRMKKFISDNHHALRELKIHQNKMWQDTKEMFRHYVFADELLNQTNAYTRHIDELERAILQLSQGYLSPLLISDKQIESAATEIMRELSNDKHIQNLLHASAHYYRRSHSFIAFRHEHSLWITLKFSIAPQKPMRLYKVNVFPMSVHKDSTFSTIIKGLPEYVIYDGKTRFAELQAKDLIHCHGTSFFKECPFNVKYWEKNSGTCMAAILNDKVSEIHDRCEFKMLKYPATPGFRVLTESNILVRNISMLNIECHGEQNEIPGCFSCVVHVPCGCRISYGTQSTDTATTQSCLEISTPVSRRYLINMAVMKSFYGDAIGKSLEASKAFIEEQNYKKPNIELYNHDYEKFLTNDKEDSYTFKKIAKVALEGRKAFHSISQALLAGEVDIPSTWDNTTLFKLLICCFVVIAILVIVDILMTIYFIRRGKYRAKNEETM